MAKYVINEAGGTHSVNDDFELPDGWEEVDESTVRQVNPGLLGEAPAEPAADVAVPEAEEAGTTE
jgi:hypothetical protein